MSPRSYPKRNALVHEKNVMKASMSATQESQRGISFKNELLHAQRKLVIVVRSYPTSHVAAFLIVSNHNSSDF